MIENLSLDSLTRHLTWRFLGCDIRFDKGSVGFIGEERPLSQETQNYSIVQNHGSLRLVAPEILDRW